MLIDYITYDFIETNNYSSVNSRGLTIKNDEINTYYTGDGLYIQNPDGNAYFNTAFGLNWQMPYGLDFSQFVITKDLFLLNNLNAQFYISSSNQNQEIDYTINSNAVLNANSSRVWVNSLDQQSLESKKKNFEKYNENAIDIIKDIDIYKYHLKTQEDSEKKHIGFVIGENYKYSQEITNNDNDSVDLYSFISLCCKAIQEQQKEIENLKEKIKLLKESDK